MAARTKTKVSPKYKTKYRVKNWAAYDIALRERGDITVWFDEEAVCSWSALPSGRPGGQRRYSDLAIVTALTLRTVFHLPLRQTEGFVTSLIGLMGLALMTPDHTTLSRRSLDVEVPRFAQGGGPLHLVIDSTSLKILGDGESQAHKHKTSNQRRSWRKLHGIDEFCWSWDGSEIAFRSKRDGNSEIYVVNADGSHLRNVTNHPARDFRFQLGSSE